jgi:hypothetical protein
VFVLVEVVVSVMDVEGCVVFVGFRVVLVKVKVVLVVVVWEL